MSKSAARPVLAASIAVFRDDGLVLLARRGAAPMAELWSLPGGKVEAGETMADAALRELREEVGVEAEMIGFNDHVEYIQRDAAGAVAAHFVIASFVGRWRAGEPTPGPEASAVAWVDPFEPGDLAMTRGLPAILRRAAVIAAKATAPEGPDSG
ncbi:MAG: NUDIX hydrolase [Rhizobiales bacterium]|nr:NUDIX hydrolase [Hyphomicrobiales bacterium]